MPKQSTKLFGGKRPTHECSQEAKKQHEVLQRCLSGLATKEDIKRLEKLMAKTQAEVTEQLNKANARIAKTGAETRKLLNLVQELKDAASNQTNASPELEAAANAVEAQVGVVDELVPDVLDQAQIDALAAAGFPLSAEQLADNTAGKAPVLTTDQINALAAAGL